MAPEPGALPAELFNPAQFRASLQGDNPVARLAAHVAHEIRNQYVIAYSPTIPALDGTYRQIRVEVKGRGKPQVRTRSGYYASASAPDRRSLTDATAPSGE